ncbi:MAG: restriction endonuclease subunit S [Fimbriimonadaceae bacterium]|nr:restriction endonuclease subunit S [Fimbriimonadaceae bacterium]
MPGDLLFARQSLVLSGAGKCCIFVGHYEPVVFESHIIRARLNQNSDPDFYFYYFNSPSGRCSVESIVEVVAAAGIRASDLVELQVPRPSLSAQRQIGAVLRAFDEKIELNRRMNETLEAMARTLFRSWFVDFDPVRAKAENRPTGLPADLDALFPSEFEDSPLGEIPKGWRAGTMEDVAVCRRRSVSTTSIADDEPYVGLEHIEKKSLALTDWGRGADVSSQKSRFQVGEILFGKLRPYFHKVCIAPVSGVCSTDILVVDAKEPGLAGFVALGLSEESTIEFVTASSGGTRMPRTSWGDLARVPMVVPTDTVAAAFGDLVRENLELVRKSVFEIQYLEEQRDFLLPKLLSGEIEVAEEDAIG